MKKLQILSPGFLVTIFCLLITCTAYAKKPPSAAQCEAGLTWTETGMDFGSYVGGVAGTIVMDATTGAMTPAGVVLVGGSAGTPLTFTFANSVNGCDKKNINITLPAGITISNAASNVIINNLITSISPKTKFKLMNTDTITIGGTLNAGAADAVGTYNGNNLFGFSY